MDQLTRFLVYNTTPKTAMDYEDLTARKKELKTASGDVDRRLMLLSPDFGRNYGKKTKGDKETFLTPIDFSIFFLKP